MEINAYQTQSLSTMSARRSGHWYDAQNVTFNVNGRTQQVQLGQKSGFLGYECITLESSQITWHERETLWKKVFRDVVQPAHEHTALVFDYRPPYSLAERIKNEEIAKEKRPALEAKLQDAYTYAQAISSFHHYINAMGLCYIVSDEDVATIPMLVETVGGHIPDGSAFTAAILWPVSGSNKPLDKLFGRVEICKPQYAEQLLRMFATMEERFKLGIESIEVIAAQRSA